MVLPDGSVTAPKIASLPKVRAVCNNQSCNALATNIIAFSTESYDTDSMHDNVTNNSRLTCNTAGVYRITANINVSTPWDGGFRQIQIRKNGTTVIGGITTAGPAMAGLTNSEFINAGITVQLAAGDYIQVIFSHQNDFGNGVSTGENSCTMEYIP